MSEAVRFHVKGWKDHQHYKARRPPWIKLHRALLDDIEFHRLHVASRALAPMLWLLASESPDGSVTADPHDLAFQLRRSPEEIVEAVKPLLAAGFLSASGVLATCYQNAVRGEERRDRERTEGPAPVSVIGENPANERALPVNGSGNGHGNGLTDPALTEYANGIWDEFVRRSGKADRVMSPLEWQHVTRWWGKGIALSTVLQALSEVKNRGDTLGYYAQAVETEHGRVGRALQR